MGQSIKFSTAIWRLVLVLVLVLLQPLGVVGTRSDIAQAASPATAEESFALPSGEEVGLHYVYQPNLQEGNQGRNPLREAAMPSAEVQAANPARIEPLPAPLPNDRFGLVYVNWPEYQESFHNLGKPESIISETTEQRYAMALGTGARWNRWPVVWSKIEPEGAHDNPQNWNWEWVDNWTLAILTHFDKRVSTFSEQHNRGF